MWSNFKRFSYSASMAALMLPAISFGQQPNNGGATDILAKSRAAMISSGIAVHDITLQGDVEYIAGSTDEKGSITLKAIMDGSSRTDISLSSSTIKETVILGDSKVKGERSDRTGALRSTALHNLMTDSAWFCPAMLIQRFVSYDRKGEIAFATGTDKNGSPIDQLTSARRYPDNPTADKEVRRLSRMDLLLDPTSYEPTTLLYQTHTDQNSLTSIPVEVAYSDYQMLDGVRVPSHIKRYINHVLTLDIHITSAVVNGGLIATQLKLQ